MTDGREFTRSELEDLEAGGIISTCDWGYCSRDVEMMRRDPGDGDWLPVCRPCGVFGPEGGNQSTEAADALVLRVANADSTTEER